MLASQAVIERIQALLVAAGLAADRVYTDRAFPVATFPALKVVHAGEDLAADPDGDDITWPERRLHELQVDVLYLAHAADNLDAALAAGALQVLQALGGTVAAATLQPLVGCVCKSLSIRYEFNSSGQAAHGTALVRFEVSFRTHSNDPQTLL